MKFYVITFLSVSGKREAIAVAADSKDAALEQFTKECAACGLVIPSIVSNTVKG